jgi:PBP1b-binding outer membrane lipoprotein LpoB
MKEIICICVVAALAIVLSSCVNQIGSIAKATRQIEARIERMKTNPNPEYDHYPFDAR